VFRLFDELGSARQVMLSLLEDNLLIPRRRAGSKRVNWAPASYPAIHDFLTNPAYAGAFVFGRRRDEKRLGPDGRMVKRTRELPREEWAVLIPEHHPGFVTWERYVAIQDRLRANWRPPRVTGVVRFAKGRPSSRPGPLRAVRADDAGRLFGHQRNTPRYICGRNKALYGGERGCQNVGGRRLENACSTRSSRCSSRPA